MVVTHFVTQFTHVYRHFGKNKKNCLGKTVVKMFIRFKGKVAYVSKKTTFIKKVQNLKRIKIKKQ